MKLLALLLLFLGSTALGQKKSDLIAGIRKQFQAINKENNYKQIRLDGEKFLPQTTDGGGELIGYYKNGALKKIFVHVGISHGNETFEFYFQSEKLIFVYEKFDQFLYDEKKNAFNFDKTETTFEGRYYFNDGKLIEQVTTGHNRFEDDTLDAEIVLKKEADRYKALLNKHRKMKSAVNSTD